MPGALDRTQVARAARRQGARPRHGQLRRWERNAVGGAHGRPNAGEFPGPDTSPGRFGPGDLITCRLLEASLHVRPTRFGLALFGLAMTIVLGGIGCDATPRGGVLGVPPRRPALRLVELPGEVTFATGTAGASGKEAGDASPPLARFDREALASWPRRQQAGALVIESPPLGAHGLAGAGSLELRLAPGGATRVALVPLAQGGQGMGEQRALRSLEVSLERDADPDAPVDLAIDLNEALHGNFGDAGREGRLAGLEIVLPGADPERVVLHALAVEARRPLPAGVPAAAIVADHQGELRSAWAVKAGARVELELQVPSGAPELRWLDAATRDTGERRVEIVYDGEASVLAREAPTPEDLGAPWTSRRAALSRFAGERVRLRLAVEGSGVGFFGEPTVLDAEEHDEGTPDVVVYLIDTLRADHLGAGGSTLAGVSPTIDRLASEGVSFRRAQSSSPWTKPAIATLMSGILPLTHQVGATSYTDRMPSSVPLLQERFRSAGWRTGSFSASPLGSTLSALERGFDSAFPPRFWQGRARLDANPSADQLHAALLAWIDEQPDRPFFAYVHTLEVHEWKLPRYRNALPEGWSAYDAAIRDADRQLGALLAALASHDRPLVVVLVSDHGESWGDHGLPSHGFGLYQSQIQIPLVFWKSGDAALAPAAVTTPVSLSDLAPSLLDGLGLPRLDESDGVSLAPLLAGRGLDRGPVLSALLRFVWAPDAPRQYAVTTPEQVVSIRPEGGPERAYDLVIDPQEQRPLAQPDPALARTLDALLASQAERARAFRARHGAVVPGPVTADDSDRLRALGYLEDPSLEDGDGPRDPDPSPHP